MILFLIFVVLFLLGFIGQFIIDYFNDPLYEISVICALIGGIIGSVMLILIIAAHINVDYSIEQNQIRYESLCKRLEIVNSEYEDVSKSDVIKDIAEWNRDVHSCKYFASNPWTNWFYSQKKANTLQYIGID